MLGPGCCLAMAAAWACLAWLEDVQGQPRPSYYHTTSSSSYIQHHTTNTNQIPFVHFWFCQGNKVDILTKAKLKLISKIILFFSSSHNVIKKKVNTNCNWFNNLSFLTTSSVTAIMIFCKILSGPASPRQSCRGRATAPDLLVSQIQEILSEIRAALEL